MATTKRVLKRWDMADDAVIVENIQKYPANFGLAFKQTGIELGRTSKAVAGRYYSALRNNIPIIAIGSSAGVLANTKNVPFKEDESTNTRKAMLLAMFGSMDPTEVIETFLSLLSIEEQKSLFKRSITKLL
jgi:hypothetical protein